MRHLLLTSASLLFVANGAWAETQILNFYEGDTVLLPPVASIAQPGLSPYPGEQCTEPRDKPGSGRPF
jgi:hypothetical protein